MKASRLVIALALVVPLATGCKKKTTEPTGDTGSGSAMTASGSDMTMGSGSQMGSGSDMSMGSGSAMAGSGSGGVDTLMSKKGGNCPSLVATSTTKVTLDEKKWTATIAVAATDKNAIASIQERTKAWKDRKPDSGTNAHDSKGGKGGDAGACAEGAPGLVVADTKDTKDGVTITLKLDADTAKGDDAFKKAALAEVQARADKGAQWMKDNLKAEPGGEGGTGDGGGNHGRDHSGKGDASGKGSGDGTGGGNQDGTGGGGGKGAGGGKGSGSATK